MQKLKLKKIAGIIIAAAVVTFISQASAAVTSLPQMLPIFMYHDSSEIDPRINEPGAAVEYYVKPSEFEKQIKYLVDNGYTFCIFDDWFDLRDIEKPVFITFDDGYWTNYTEIYPVLQKYDAKATIFLVTDEIGKRRRLTEFSIREMSNSRLVKFESHTMSHMRLTEISPDEQRLENELKMSKERIEGITRRRVLAISYPSGRFNDTVKEKTSGIYKFGVSTIHGKHNTAIHSDFEIRRIGVGRSVSMEEFIEFLEE